MVRLKHRYILFEILYPPLVDGRKTPGEEFVNFSKSQNESLMTLHQSSAGSINPRTLSNTIRTIVQDIYGDIGLGQVGQSIIVKYFSNKTSTGILRCGRDNYKKVVAAMTLIEEIEGNNVLIKCTRVSGTIKKSEEFSIARSQQLIRILNKGELSASDLNALFESFKGNKDDDDE